MSNTAILEKILNVKEKEKEDAQLRKTAAVDYFEKTAQQLYMEFKRKEDAETELQTVMEAKIAIANLKEQSQYIHSMNNKINTLQPSVQAARSDMEQKQVALTEAHVEVKKIERLIELRQEESKEREKQEEMSRMDEISIRQFQKQTQNG